MTRILLISLLMISVLQSCEQKENAIEDEKLVRILGDLLIADEVIVKYGGTEDEYYRNFLKKQILEIHDLEEEEFDSTMGSIQTDLLRYFNLQNEVEEYLKELEENPLIKN